MNNSGTVFTRLKLPHLAATAAVCMLIAVAAVVLAASPSRAGTVARAHSAVASSAHRRSHIRHVFVIVLENESAATTFGAGSPAPYLAHTLTRRGAFLPNYYGVGHASLDNYVAMISGQAPNHDTSSDCPDFVNFPTAATGAYHQQQGSGCVYPSDIPTITSQLSAAGDTWRDYNQDMGADPARESSTCAHPKLGAPDNTEVGYLTDMYATRHDPFVYFHSIIDHHALCSSHVVNLNHLTKDLRRVSTTRNYTFITPDLCDDGHDSPCRNGDVGGLTQADQFLRHWVPKITASKAFRDNGLLVITFDEAGLNDPSSCCGEIPGPGSLQPGLSGPGGGRVGAVLLSPCIVPGTIVRTPYNHYTLLGSIENIFGLKHLGYAGLPGESYFGAGLFKRSCGAT